MIRRKPVGLLIALLLLSVPVPSWAGETIRVAVLVDRPALSIDSPETLRIESGKDPEVVPPDKLIQLLPGPHGIRINGRETRRRQLDFVASRGHFVLNGVRYTGSLKVIQRPRGLTAVNRVDVEEYLKGVVPAEISPDWHPEALKVQAVSARTYALYQRELRGDMDYDLLSTTADQVYSGQSAERFESSHAVEETRGLVAAYHGHLILAAYHSTSAGRTEDAAEVWGIDLPYLKGVDCPFDRYSPRFQWTREISTDRIQEAFASAGYAIGLIAAITPFDTTPSGRAGRVRVLHSDGELILSGAELRRVIGYTEVPSARYLIEAIGQRYRFVGNGSGHGVGLCQWGAKEMAEMGYSYRTILRYFYPGAEVVAYDGLRESAP